METFCGIEEQPSVRFALNKIIKFCCANKSLSCDVRGSGRGRAETKGFEKNLDLKKT